MEEILENIPFRDLIPGMSAGITRTLSEKDILLFAYATGDINPAHLDEEYSKNDLFHARIGHGLWTAALISAVLGTKLPGPGTIYLEQSLKFARPVMIGDTITATVTVKHLDAARNRARLDCLCVNQQGKPILSGEALVLVPLEKIRRNAVSLPEVVVTPTPLKAA